MSLDGKGYMKDAMWWAKIGDQEVVLRPWDCAWGPWASQHYREEIAVPLVNPEMRKLWDKPRSWMQMDVEVVAGRTYFVTVDSGWVGQELTVGVQLIVDGGEAYSSVRKCEVDGTGLELLISAVIGYWYCPKETKICHFEVNVALVSQHTARHYASSIVIADEGISDDEDSDGFDNPSNDDDLCSIDPGFDRHETVIEVCQGDVSIIEEKLGRLPLFPELPPPGACNNYAKVKLPDLAEMTEEQRQYYAHHLYENLSSTMVVSPPDCSWDRGK